VVQHPRAVDAVEEPESIAQRVEVEQVRLRQMNATRYAERLRLPRRVGQAPSAQVDDVHIKLGVCAREPNGLLTCAATRHELTELGTEVALEGTLTEPADGSPGVRVRGRIDRLEQTLRQQRNASDPLPQVSEADRLPD
jgi:hypothetical protein